WRNHSLTKKWPFIERVLGFQLCSGSDIPKPGKTHDISVNAITVPHWFVILLSLSFPAILVRRYWRKRYRLRHGLCTQCGYDLRKSNGKCPECGTEREGGANVAEGAKAEIGGK